jgi:hypothetical protein
MGDDNTDDQFNEHDDQNDGLYIDRTEGNRYNGNLTSSEYQTMIELFDRGFRRYQTNLHFVKNGLSVEESLEQLRGDYQYRIY